MNYNDVKNSPLPSNIRAISLDFGNTLYDYYYIVFYVVNQCWKQHHSKELKFNQQFILAYYTAFAEIDEQLKRKKLTRLNQGDTDYWKEFYSILFESLGEETEIAGEEAQYVTQSWSQHPTPKLFPDVIPFLELCITNGIKIALLSNTMDDYPRSRVTKDNLANYFDIISLSYEINSWKPDVKIFEATIKKLDVKKNEIIHIGDEFWQDMLGAARAGIHGIWRVLTVRNEFDTSFKQITSLMELQSLFDPDN